MRSEQAWCEELIEVDISLKRAERLNAFIFFLLGILGVGFGVQCVLQYRLRQENQRLLKSVVEERSALQQAIGLWRASAMECHKDARRLISEKQQLIGSACAEGRLSFCDAQYQREGARP